MQIPSFDVSISDKEWFNDLLETKDIIEHITNKTKIPKSFTKEFWKAKKEKPLFYETEFIGIQNHSKIDEKSIKCYLNGFNWIKLWNDDEIICGIEVIEKNTRKYFKHGKIDTKNENIFRLKDREFITKIEMSSSDKGITSINFFL